MKTPLFRNWPTLVLLLALLSGCAADHPLTSESVAPEKIEFPLIEHTLDPRSDTTIFGPQGTRIFIGAGTFQFADGRAVDDPITIELKEFYDKADMLLAELYTRSDDRLIETAGMIHIEATSNGQKISIKEDKRIVVHFPKAPNDRREMDLFHADATATDSSVSNWTVDTVSLFKRTLRLGSFGWWDPAHDDSTKYDFTPKNYVDTGYFWNPLDYYVSSYEFSEQTMREIETTMNRNDYPKFEWWNTYGVECEMRISPEGEIIVPKVRTPVSGAAKKEILKFLRELPTLEPGKDKYGNVIERRGLLLLRPGNIVPLYKTEKEYITSFDTKYAQFENSPIKSMDDAELNYYVFSVSKLGWINCDRFIGLEETTDLIVETPIVPNTKLKMAFSDIDGVLRADEIDGRYVFRNVPIGHRVTIVGIRNEDGHFQTAFKETVITDQPLGDLPFAETTLADMRAQLERI